jgi:hypothetical protein
MVAFLAMLSACTTVWSSISFTQAHGIVGKTFWQNHWWHDLKRYRKTFSAEMVKVETRCATTHAMSYGLGENGGKEHEFEKELKHLENIKRGE